MNCANHPQAPAAAYCRTCGKALCEECKRDVMGAIYCEPCIAARLQVGTPATTDLPIAPASPSGLPNPAVATMLGFIPGVGAMYNGQFAKALIHVAILGMLITIAKHVNDVFGLAIVFFWFYMVFDAYKTANARQLGLPDPDLLRLHRLFGIHEGAPVASTAPPTPSTPVSSTADSSASSSLASDLPAGNPFTRSGQAPTGAFILIGLGVFFLLYNFGLFRFGSLFRLGRMWPLLIIGLGLWLAFRRTMRFDTRSNQ